MRKGERVRVGGGGVGGERGLWEGGGGEGGGGGGGGMRDEGFGVFCGGV